MKNAPKLGRIGKNMLMKFGLCQKQRPTNNSKNSVRVLKKYALLPKYPVGSLLLKLEHLKAI